MDAPERGAELVGIIINDAGEPDAIARAIAPIYRQAEEARDECREILWYMIQAAFNVSAAHRFALDEYLAAIEEGREPSEEARARFASQRQGVESEAEVSYGSSVLLSGSDGATLFQNDFADDKQESKLIEFHILDETGTPLRSIVVRAQRFDPETEEK